MKLDRRCLILLLCSVILLCAGTGAAAEAVRDAEAETSLYRDLLLSFDYGDTVTYVIGHKSPDSDTVGSGYYVFDEIYSRKMDVVPALTDALN